MTRLLSLVTLAIMVVMPAWSTYYTVIDPNVRSGCTPRCKDTSSAGAWRCSDVDRGSSGGPLNICNTFELAGTHTCHYHYFSPPEIGQCLSSQQADIIIMGQSNMFGLTTSVFSYFNRDDGTAFNTFKWLDDKANDNHRVFGCYSGGDLAESSALQINLDPNGLIKWKGGAAQGSSIKDMLDMSKLKDPTTDGSFITYIRANTTDTMLGGLDALRVAGRNTRKAFLIMNCGGYFPDTTTYRSALLQTVEALRKDFPNYTIIFTGYFLTGDVKFNTVMQEIMATYSVKTGVTPPYRPMHYLNTFDMHAAANAPPLVMNHQIHVFYHAVFQRALSIACDYMPAQECEEQVIGSSNCNYDSTITSWWKMLGRQCNLMTYTSNIAPFPSPPQPLSVSPQAPKSMLCTDADKDGYTTCGGDCNDNDASIKPCMGGCSGAAPITIAAPTGGSTSTVVVQPVCPNVLSSQCGGLVFQGNTCCPDGTTCTVRNEYWSDCQLTPAATVSVVSEVPKAVCSNVKLSRCGGKTWTGATCCPDGFYCKYANLYWSDCQLL